MNLNVHDLLNEQGARWRANPPAAPSLHAMSVRAQAIENTSRRARSLPRFPRDSLPPESPSARRTFHLWSLPMLAATAAIVVVAATFLWTGNRAADRTPAANPAPRLPISSQSVPLTGPSIPGSVPGNVTTPCRGGDFTAGTVVQSRIQDGEVLNRVVLRFDGVAPCLISNRGATVSILSTGATLASGYDTLDYKISPGTIQPGFSIVTGARWRYYCNGSAVPDRLQLDLGNLDDTAGHTVVIARFSTFLVPECHIATANSDAFAALGLHPRLVNTGSPQSLLDVLSAPASVPVGSPVNFNVTLTNATNEAVRFQPCPHYVVELGDIKQEQVLRCSAAPEVLEPGAVIVVAVRLGITGAVATGTRRLAWYWAGSDTTVDANAVTITLSPAK
jgi:hypothetical protein